MHEGFQVYFLPTLVAVTSYYRYMGFVDGKTIKKMALSGGDQAREGFQVFWEAYYKKLHVFAGSYRGLPGGERDDAVVEALITAYQAIGSYDPGRPLAPWVYRVAANRFSDAVRRAGRVSTLAIGPVAAGSRSAMESIDPPASGDLAEESVDRDLVERFRLAINELPEGDRRIAMLRFYEDMSAAEIGKALGIPAGTVRWRIHAIRGVIKAAVGEDSG